MLQSSDNRLSTTSRGQKPNNTMQSADAKLHQSCLLLALRRYSSAVHNMEHTVMLPSLLREVPSEDSPDSAAAAADVENLDLYGCYHMLKAIRAVVESSMVPLDDARQAKPAHKALGKTIEPLVEADPEAAFVFHLRGLLDVMGSLTKRTQKVTTRYMDIIGIAR